jgi:hypothetical protein
MTLTDTSTQTNDYAWLIAVPKRAEFSEPPFHYGERVKFSCLDEKGRSSWETGRITGMKWKHCEWVCTVELDAQSPMVAVGVTEVNVRSFELKLVRDSASVREQLQLQQQWFHTAEAAARLGISPEQLRKLRLNGLFKSSYHYRDTSIPGSGRPCWQWHVERCSKALSVAPEKRPGVHK